MCHRDGLSHLLPRTKSINDNHNEEIRELNLPQLLSLLVLMYSIFGLLPTICREVENKTRNGGKGKKLNPSLMG